MARRDSTVTIRNFLGLNRRDAGEKVKDNQFYRIQNFYQAIKGFFFKRFGTAVDLSSASFFGASAVTGIHRNYGLEKCTLYFCEPDAALLPTPGAGPVLTEIAGGDLFGGDFVEPVKVCFKWCGFGAESEQSPDSTITVSDVTKGVRVTIPAFPAGIKSANVFAKRASGEYAYMGTVYAPGTLDIKHFMGPSSAFADAMTSLDVTVPESNAGSLVKGTYYISAAWVVGAFGASVPTLSAATAARVRADNGKIDVKFNGPDSTNLAKSIYVFIGTKTEKEHPMTCVGILKAGETLTISKIPTNTSAQSHPDLEKSSGAGSVPAKFNNTTSAGNPNRIGFILKKDSAGFVTEIFPSRTLGFLGSVATKDPYTGETTLFNPYTFGGPKTKADETRWLGVASEPVFTWFNGLSYFVNSVDIPWQTDGFAMGQIARVSGTLLPRPPKYIATFQNMLLTGGGEQGNQIYACNAFNSQNWAVGGSGSANRFVTIGDSYGDGVTAIGVFTLATEAVNDPRAYFLAFKKHGVFMKDTFPDPTSGVGAPLQQLSGRVGCIAYRSIVQTPIGVMFLGSDADIYLIRGGGEPVRVGTSVQPVLDHLKLNDDLMKQATAVFHDNHYKLCYSPAGSTTNDEQLWADIRITPQDQITWTGPHTGLKIGPQIVLVGETDDFSRIACRQDAIGTIKLDDTSTMQDIGSNIVSTLESKTYRFKDEAHMKRIMGAIFDCYYDPAYQNDLLFEAFADEYYQQVNKSLSNGSAIWDSSSFDSSMWGGGQYVGVPCPLSASNLIGRTFKYRLTHSNASQFVIAATTIQIKPERRLLI